MYTMRMNRSIWAIVLVLCLLAPIAALADAPAAPAVDTAALEARVGVTAAQAAEKYPNALAKNSHGDVVKAVQAKLIELGYLDDIADGAFGNKTLAAVQLFQEEQGFAVTGELSALEQYYLIDAVPLTRTEVIISKADPSNIASVQAALNALTIRVTSAKVLVQSKLNKATYPDMLTAVVQNDTSSAITGYTVGFLAFDANGAAVQILTQYDETAYYEILGDAVDIRLAAGGSFGSSYGWRLQENHGIVYLIACVQSVTFEDGSTWENPVYSIWKEAFAEKTLDESLRV